MFGLIASSIRRGIVADVVAGVTTLASAIAAAADGTTLIIDGVFDEDNITIPNNRTLTLEALTPGSAEIRSWNAATSPAWSLDTASTYYTTLAYHPFSVFVNGRALYDFNYSTSAGTATGTLTNLKNATWPSGATGASGSAPPEGYFWDTATNRLYIRIRNDADTAHVDPSTINSQITWTRNGVNSGSNGHGIKLGTNNVLTLDGLIIDGFPNSGVLLTSGSTLNLQNTKVRNTYRGYSLTNPAATPIVRITNCTFSGRGAGTSPYNGPYMIRKTLGNGAFQGLYDSNLSFRAALIHTTDMQITGCYIHDLFDGIEFKGISTTPHGTTSDISYNFIQNIVDNPTEIEPDERYVRVRVHHNFMLDGSTYHATAPFLAGVCEYDHNILHTSSEYGLATSFFLKTLSHSLGTWDARVLTQSGLATHHNTVLLGVGSQSGSLYVVGSDVRELAENFSYNESSAAAADSYFRDNIVRLKNSRAWGLADRDGTGHTGYLLSQHNTIYGDSITANHYRNASAGGTPPANAATHGDSRPTAGVNTTAPTFQTGAAVLFYLNTNRLGSDGATSMGAVNFGETWTMPDTGVSFSANSDDAPLPASVDGFWGGR